MELRTRGEVAKEVGLTRDGVQYWIGRGALRADHTTVGGIGLYGPGAIERFRRIRERRLRAQR